MPEHWVVDLWVRVQGREQVRVWHRGQVYLAGWPQMAHEEEVQVDMIVVGRAEEGDRMVILFQKY